MISNSVTPLRSVRRARLARLREEAEPLAAEERRTALRTLLQHPLLTADGPRRDLFVRVRRHREYAADWFADRAGWSLAVTAELARLRKYPADAADATRGAIEPRSGEIFTRARYALFCLALAALERGDLQITLGRLAEAVAASLAADPAFAEAGFGWSLDKGADRRDFVHALRLLDALGVLRKVQGDEEQYLRDPSSDVLYNVARPVLAALLAVRRSPSLVEAGGLEDRLKAILDPQALDSPEARNRALRLALTRKLLDDPVLYYASLTEEARVYFDRQRGSLLPELAAATGLEPEVRAEGVALADLDGDCTDLGLPEEGTEGHLTILVATWLADRLRAAPGEVVILTQEALRQQIARLIRRHRHHWRRDVAQKGAETWFAAAVAERLAGLGLVELSADGVRPLPALGRFGYRETDAWAGMDELPLGDASE